MPWKPSDAKRHTRKATTKKSQRQWSHVADSMLKRGYSEGRSIAAANSVIKKGRKSKSGKPSRRKKGRRSSRY
jgi:hypothetical protein